MARHETHEPSLAIALALGQAAAISPALRWDAVWSVALRERIAMSAWIRSGDIIRREAPSAVVARWRQHALSASEHVAGQRAALLEAMVAFGARGIDAVVLKGIPLAIRLYGDAAARVSTDIDLAVPAERRDEAREVLRDLGWSVRYGRAPWDETLERVQNGKRWFLELHSTLVHESLAHLRLDAGRVERATLGPDAPDVPTLALPTLAVYLAAHAAIHDRPSLLWVLDFALLRRSASEVDRAESRAIARTSRLHRHFAWAERCADALEEAAGGSVTALRVLGMEADGSRRDRPFLRALSLAATPVDAARVASAWAWPRYMRDDRSATVAMLMRRTARLATRVRGVGYGTEAAVSGSPHDARQSMPGALELDRSLFLPLVREVVQRGATVWVRVRGASMSPAIPPGSLVRLCPPPAQIRKGDVVLASTPAGLPVLHRVKSVGKSVLCLQGDALPRPDPHITPDAVVAWADRLRIADGERPLPKRGARPWRRIGAEWSRRVSVSSRTS